MIKHTDNKYKATSHLEVAFLINQRKISYTNIISVRKNRVYELSTAKTSIFLSL